MTNLDVFYDGSCPACHRMITHYEGLPGGELINFVDVTNKMSFKPYEKSLSKKEAMRVMHAQAPGCPLVAGVEALIMVWLWLPKYQWRVKLFTDPVLKPVVSVIYRAFTYLRFCLPKSQTSSSVCPKHW